MRLVPRPGAWLNRPVSPEEHEAARERAAAFVGAWEDAVARRDLAAAAALLEDDVVFHSPVLHRPTEGRDAVAFLLGLVMEVFGPFRYADTWTSEEGSVVLGFETSVEHEGRTLQVQGVDVFHLGGDGRAERLTVMVRPLSALQALAAQMRERLTAPGSGEAEPPGT